MPFPSALQISFLNSKTPVIPVSLLSHQAEKSVIDVLETMEQKLEESLEAVTSSADGILTILILLVNSRRLLTLH